MGQPKTIYRQKARERPLIPENNGHRVRYDADADEEIVREGEIIRKA